MPAVRQTEYMRAAVVLSAAFLLVVTVAACHSRAGMAVAVDGGDSEDASDWEVPVDSHCRESLRTYCAREVCVAVWSLARSSWCPKIAEGSGYLASVDTCGGYKLVFDQLGVDTSRLNVYDPTTGAIVAVYYDGLASSTCVAGPSDGPPGFQWPTPSTCAMRRFTCPSLEASRAVDPGTFADFPFPADAGSDAPSD